MIKIGHLYFELKPSNVLVDDKLINDLPFQIRKFPKLVFYFDIICKRSQQAVILFIYFIHNLGIAIILLFL